MQPHARQQVATLRLCRWPMKSQVSSGWAAALACEVLGAVLADERDARLGERAELVERHVLDRGEQLDVARVAPGGGDLVADARQVRRARGRRRGRGSAAATRSPPGGPVTPPSRRWEKKRSGSHIVQSPQSWTSSTPACVEPLARDRLEVDASRAARAAARRGPPRRPRSSTARRRARSPRRSARRRARAARRRPRPGSPPASPRQPAWSIATPSGAISATGRQSAAARPARRRARR